MEIIRPGFGDCIDGAGGVRSVLSGNSAGLDFKFLQCIGERKRQIESVERIVVRPTV